MASLRGCVLSSLAACGPICAQSVADVHIADGVIRIEVPDGGIAFRDFVQLTERLSKREVSIGIDDAACARLRVASFGPVEVGTHEFFTLFEAVIRTLGLRCKENGEVVAVDDADQRLRVPARRLAFALDRGLAGHANSDLPLVAAIELRALDPLAARRRLRELLAEGADVQAVTTHDALICFASGRRVCRAREVLRHLDVADEEPLEKVAGELGFAEGPAWDPIDGVLLFSDIRGDRILSLDGEGELRVFREPSGRSNGLAFDPHGVLYACLGGRRELVRIARDGTETVLASSFGGKRLNSPNDLALDGAGGVWFTDPRYGDASDVEQDVMGVYYLAANGDLTRVIDELERPNGVVCSADGKTLFVAEPNRREIHAYPIERPGVLGAGRVWFRSFEALDGRGPDGMALDENGVLYATYENLLAIDPTGRVVRRMPVPERPTNCAFGGANGRTLFVTARTGLYRRELGVGGAGR